MTSIAFTDDFEVIDHEEASLGPEKIGEVQRWLQPSDYLAKSSEFSRHLLSQAPGTGLWVCDTQRYQQWHDSRDHGSIWIKGVPGAGKSVIAASLIEHLKATEDAPVLFFFFRYIIAANRKPRSLIQDWLAQLLPHCVRLQLKLEPLIDGSLKDISDDILWEYLLIGLQSMEKIWCIVDGIDEMETTNSGGFLSRLNGLATFRPDSVKLLMTSRPKQYLQRSLRDASIVHINLENDLVGNDIAAFVSYRLKNALPDNETLRTSLQSTICSRSQGLFLYARLLLDQIIPTLGASQYLDIQQLARSLPIGLEDMYDSMLTQQLESLKIERSIQVFLLEWVIFSSGILRLNQLASVLELCFPGMSKPKDTVRLACSPLLEILEDETVQVIHHSFTEFLLEPGNVDKRSFPILDSKDIHKRLCIFCLRYLQSGALSSENGISKPHANCECENEEDCHCPIIHDSFDYQDARLHHPFLEYAVKNWPYHASLYDVNDSEFFSAINAFMSSENLSFRRWLTIDWSISFSASNASTPSALHVAACIGLVRYAESLSASIMDVQSRDADQRTPLHWACRCGHTNMVSFLLANGADPDAEDSRGVKPLHEAALKNSTSIVKLLLEAGVDPLTPKTKENHSGRLLGGERITKGQTAVQYVCENGHTEAIVAMLPFLKQEVAEEVLCESCRYGKPESVVAMFEHSNISANSSFRGATALFQACRSRSLACVELLLARGADVHAMSEWEPKQRINGGQVRKEIARSPLHGLVQGWRDENRATCQAILDLLLKAGADIESRNGSNETPLMTAFGSTQHHRIASLSAIQSLLKTGASISATDIHGNTIFPSFLNKSRDVKMVESLLDYGANINATEKNGDFALHIALRAYIQTPSNTVDEMVTFLLERGASPHAKNTLGETPLVIAARNGQCSLDVIKTLLKSSDEQARKACLWSLRDRGSKEQIVKLLRLLMAAGVSLESRDARGRTPLHAQPWPGPVQDALLECGALVNAIDLNGKGLLHHYIMACSQLLVKSVDHLVSLGINPLDVDKDGNTVLHEAAKRYRGSTDHAMLITRLLEYGISPNAVNSSGRTPLHIYFEEASIWATETSSTQSSRLIGNSSTPISLLEALKTGDVAPDLNIQDNDGLSCLHIASMSSEINVARLLEAGTDTMSVTKEGRNVLHLAARAGTSGIVGLLLSKTGSQLVNQADRFGRTPLHDACISGRSESVNYLLRHGASVNLKDKDGRTPLHSCAGFLAEQAIWSSLAERNPTDTSRKRDRFRPMPRGGVLPSLVLGSNWTFRVSGSIKLLLAAGADVLSRDSKSLTPLDLAQKSDCWEMVSSLSLSMEGGKLPLEQDVKLRLETDLAAKLNMINGCLHDTTEKDPSALAIARLNEAEIDLIAQFQGPKSEYPAVDGLLALSSTAAAYGMVEVLEVLPHAQEFCPDPESQRHQSWKSAKREPKVYPYTNRPTLHAACERGLPNMQMLELLVNKFAMDVNIKKPVTVRERGRLPSFIPGPAPLHKLAEGNHWWQLDAIKYLIQNGASIDQVNEDGETPLHIAAVGRSFTNVGGATGFWRPHCVKIFLDLGADPNALDSEGLSPLNKASRAPEIMTMLLKGGADINAGKSSPLFSAIQSQDLESLKTLLDAGVNPDSIDTTNTCQVHWTVQDQMRLALMCAARPYILNQRIEASAPLVKLLIERGANIYAPLSDRETLIHYIFEFCDYEIVLACVESSENINFNARDQRGRTVLHAACNWREIMPGYHHKHWSPKVPGPLLAVIDSGADFLAVDNDQKNVLHHLLDNPDIEDDTILAVLQREESSGLVQQKDAAGYLPVHYALKAFRPSVCEALMKMGANILDSDPTGATAFHHIAWQCFLDCRAHRTFWADSGPKQDFRDGCERIWQKCLNMGGDINARDEQGDPPLFRYLLNGDRKKVEGGKQVPDCHVKDFPRYFGTADIDVTNNDGENALHIIARGPGGGPYDDPMHNRNLFEFMISKGLDPLAEDAKGRSSLDVAAACEKKSILDLFQYIS